MDDYIERKAALLSVMRAGCMANTVQLLKDLPAADVAPVRHGRWKRRGKNLGECSECGEVVAVRHRYCPNCGAVMDVRMEEDNG